MCRVCNKPNFKRDRNNNSKWWDKRQFNKKIEKYLSNPRVILINKENGGVSSARNAGLEIARGEYISFVDSDDFIELTMLEDLYNKSKRMDIVFSNFAWIDSLENNIKIEKNNFKNLEIKEGSYFYNIELGYVVNRIYNHKFLKKFNIKFKENMLMEDLLFSLKVFLDIDLLKKFYWKNRLITKKYLRRVLEFKLKKVVKKLF